MLTEICAELRNWFVVPNGVHIQTYTISGGSIAPLDFLQEGQYFRIIGSVFNDGVHQYPASDLTDETFHGAVWSMAIPPSVIDLAAEIAAERLSELASSNNRLGVPLIEEVVEKPKRMRKKETTNRD